MTRDVTAPTRPQRGGQKFQPSPDEHDAKLATWDGAAANFVYRLL